MTNFQMVVGALIALGIALFFFSPSFRQLLRINGGKAITRGSTAVERVQDSIDEVAKKIPGQRQAVAQMKTAADNAAAAAQNKRDQVEVLFKKVNTATNANASAETISTLKQQWLSAKNAIPGLDAAAVEAHDNFEQAQTLLEGMIATLQESQAGIEKLQSDAQLTEIYQQSTEFRNQVNDLKSGLSKTAADVKSVQDGLATARNAAELSRGTKAEREMEDIERQTAAASADDAFAAEVAARNGGAAQ